MITNTGRTRGRPRRFDPEQAVATAQQLFHARGFDTVSVADLTGALGINPPSFYAAFGSKAGLYARVVARYGAAGAIPIADALRPDRPVAEGLAALLETTARNFASNPGSAGCFLLEGMRCNDPEAREAAQSANALTEEAIRRFIAARHPEDADRLTDFVTTAIAGLSDKARNGHGLDRLLSSARLAGAAVAQALRG